MITLPSAFEKRMRTLLGENFSAYLAALEKPPVRAFRVNTDKISVSDFERISDIPAERIPYVENGYCFEGDGIGNHPFHHAGMIYVQEPAAMAPAECIDVDPSWRVLDLCAAPGGKSTQLKNKLGENGVLVSNEIISSRCRILTGNVERLGLTNTVTTCLTTEQIAERFPKTFDLIMADAPCSGEGMFRKEENAIPEWSEENVRTCAERQAKILDNAVLALKDGGYIVYATCTFSLEENEMTVDAFLTRHPEFEIVPVTDRVRENTADGICFDGCNCPKLSFARRFYPHTGRGEGQFMAVLHSTLTPTASRRKKPEQKKEKIPPCVTEFLSETLAFYEKDHVMMYNGNPAYFTPDFSVPEKTAFCLGVTIGEARGSYVQPHHQLFMAMGKHFKRKIELSGDPASLAAYLRGEEIAAPCESGWAVVTVHGCPVGGAKVSGGRAKNHYPKGLRTKG